MPTAAPTLWSVDYISNANEATIDISVVIIKQKNDHGNGSPVQKAYIPLFDMVAF